MKRKVSVAVATDGNQYIRLEDGACVFVVNGTGIRPNLEMHRDSDGDWVRVVTTDYNILVTPHSQHTEHYNVILVTHPGGLVAPRRVGTYKGMSEMTAAILMTVQLIQRLN